MPTIERAEASHEAQDDGESTRDILSAAFDSAMENVADDESVVDDVEVEEHETEEEEPKPRRTAKERERDESGRFKPKADKSAQESGAVHTIEQPAIAVEADPLETPVLAPPSWAADAREQFNQLPPRLKQEVVKRETDLRRGLQQATERAAQVSSTWAEVDQALAPKAEIFRRNGVTPGRVVSQLMAWQDYLDSNPVNALHDLAQSYGLDLGQVAQQRAQQPQEPAYVRELRQQVNQVTGLLTQQQMQQQAQQKATIASEIQNFASEVDAHTGALVRPHVEHVIDDMVPFLQQLRAANPQMPVRSLLQSAYEKALWANPSTRELELKRSQAVSKPNLEKARRAAKLVNGEARAMVTKDEPTDLRSVLSAAYDRANGK